jgi:shikimate dehydrogenase
LTEQPDINGRTRWAGVIGWPVGHSKSPLIHNHWCRRYGIDAVYLPLPVQPQALPLVVPALAQMGCVGVNLTIPHKEEVLPLVQELDAFARTIGAVNTLVVKEGVLRGYNTDAYGFWHNLEVNGPVIKRESAFVVGAGGAARAVVAALDAAGFETVYVMNRTAQKAEALQSVSAKVQVVEWFPAPDELESCSLLVNTTSLGMPNQPPLEIALGKLPRDAVVTDIVYTPLETPLLKAARMLDLHTVDGVGMLLYQAQKAFELWFGVLPEVTDALRQQVLEASV